MITPLLPAESSPRGIAGIFTRHVHLTVPVCIIGAVFVVIAPLPTLLMDLLLAANIAFAVVVLLTTTQVRNPLHFSVFPSLLLGTTLARLVLNIATTRLILTRAPEHGVEAAGGVISAFGGFVTSGSAAVGLILFLVLVAVQFLVITKGATRVSEVAARFALDGMPGRQAAIDANLTTGVISVEQAQAERQGVIQQADFYGAMDGASRFVRGDAVAGLVITFVNILGGLAIGVFQYGMSPFEAAAVFTTLTIGDGLVSQLPAFMVAAAAGLLVTRTSLDSNLSQDAVGQTFAFPVVLYAAAGMLVMLSLTGLPMVPLLCLATGCAIVGRSIAPAITDKQSPHEAQAEEPHGAADSPSSDSLFIPGQSVPLTLEIGFGLLSLTRAEGSGSLVAGLAEMRQRLALEMGFVIPKLRVRDNLMLGFREMAVSLEGVTITVATVEADHSGIRQILDHTESAIRRHGHDLLSRQQVHELLDHMRSAAPQLVSELTPNPLRIGQIHQVLRSLLSEQVSIRNLDTILSALADAAHETTNVDQLVQATRRALGRRLCQQLCRRDGSLPAITLDPMFEASLAEGFTESASEELISEVQSAFDDRLEPAQKPVLVCRADLRMRLLQQLRPHIPGLAVLSRREIPGDVRVDVIKEIGQSLLTTTMAVA